MVPADAQRAAASRPQGRAQASADRPSIALFWRTFILLCALLLVCIAAWLQAFISLEIAPRAVQNAQQLASLVNLSRASLLASDAIGRVLLIKTLAEQEGLRITVRQSADQFVPRRAKFMQGTMVEQLQRQIGESAVVAESVNGQPGLWIGFEIEGDAYWLQTDEARLDLAAVAAHGGLAVAAGLGADHAGDQPALAPIGPSQHPAAPGTGRGRAPR